MGCRKSPIVGFEACKSKEVNGVCSIEGAIDEPNDSERFISGGERREETVSRFLGGEL